MIFVELPAASCVLLDFKTYGWMCQTIFNLYVESPKKSPSINLYAQTHTMCKQLPIESNMQSYIHKSKTTTIKRTQVL